MKDTDDIKSDAEENSTADDTQKSEQEIWDDIIKDYTATGDDDQDPPAEDVDDDSDGRDEFAADDVADDLDGEGDADPSDDDRDKTRDQLVQRYKSEAGRVRGSKRRADAILKQLREIDAEAASELEDPELEERLAAISEEYGDVAGPLVDAVKGMKTRLDKQDEKAASRKGDLEAELEDIQEAEMDVLTDIHEDGFAVVEENGDLFRQWIEDQPKRVRDAFEANREGLYDGKAAALVISEFKEALAQAESDGDEKRPSARRQKQLAGARATRQKSRTATVREPSSDDDDPDRIWEYAVREAQKLVGR